MPLAVDANDRGLRLVRVDDAADVLDVDRRVAGALPPDDDVLHRPDDLELVVRVEVVVEAAHVDVAGGQEEVRVVDRAHHLEDGQALGVQLVAVEVHGDLAHFAAVDRRRRDAAQPLDLGLNDVVGQIAELPLVEVATGDR
jgi:hypothetical protein